MMQKIFCVVYFCIFKLFLPPTSCVCVYVCILKNKTFFKLFIPVLFVFVGRWATVFRLYF